MTALLLVALWANTAHVRDVAIHDGLLWTATSSGVEQYDLGTSARLRVFTTADGLDSNDVRRVSYDRSLVVRTPASVCSLQPAGSFRCLPAPPLALPGAKVESLWQGARETARLEWRGNRIVATDGAGVWVEGRRLTPAGQLCANHVQALAEFRGHVWVGTFDSGLCVLEEGAFRSVPGPFRMINGLHAAGAALWVASAEGLFVTRDGRTFRREKRLRERAVNGLASSRRSLFATTPFALYAIRLDGTAVVRRWPRPAGSTALQAVAVSGDAVWLASEDAGAIRLRRGRFETFDRASGLPSSWAVDVAPAPGGGIWVATLRDGALRLGPGGEVLERLAEGSWGLRLDTSGDRVLFGTQQGIAGLDVALPDRRVHAFLRTREGLWIGTEGGLLHLEGAAKSLTLHK